MQLFCGYVPIIMKNQCYLDLIPLFFYERNTKYPLIIYKENPRQYLDCRGYFYKQVADKPLLSCATS